MVSRDIPRSIKLLLAGLGWFLLFVLLLTLGGPVSEASVLTRLTFFIGLIPPPVCFGAGVFLAFWREAHGNRFGVWANSAAVLLHAGAMIVILQAFLG